MTDCLLKGVDLSPKNEIDFDKCIICQRKSGNLTSEQNGRKKITETSEKLNDSLVSLVKGDLSSSIKYHMKCYRSYTRKGDRVPANPQTEENYESSFNMAPSVSKRSKRTSISTERKANICIINRSIRKREKHLGSVKIVELKHF